MTRRRQRVGLVIAPLTVAAAVILHAWIDVPRGPVQPRVTKQSKAKKAKTAKKAKAAKAGESARALDALEAALASLCAAHPKCRENGHVALFWVQGLLQQISVCGAIRVCLRQFVQDA